MDLHADELRMMLIGDMCIDAELLVSTCTHKDATSCMYSHITHE
jgi:hypothetical protein